MKDILVKKSTLIEKLKKNRAAHHKIFEEALVGYRKQAIKLLDQQLKRAKSGKKFHTYIVLTVPQDQTKDYDRAIGMLAMDLSDEVALSENDYRCYVLDEWNWKDQFLSTNSAYSRTASAMFARSD